MSLNLNLDGGWEQRDIGNPAEMMGADFRNLCFPAECNILERFVLRQCGAVAACESRLLRAAANGSLRGDAPLGSMTSY
jgi:hypothetical protein